MCYLLVNFNKSKFGKNINKYLLRFLFSYVKIRMTYKRRKIKDGEKEEIYNLIWTLKELDVVFPILHGIGGEDGTIQGMLELLKVPYVGCGVLASAVGMDKVYSKIIFKEVGIQQAKYLVIYYKNDKYYIRENGIGEELKFEKIIEKLKFPMFVKPSNSGSSVGVKKANDVNELKLAIENASKYDRKIIIEEGIKGKEVECAILEKKDEIIASTVGEIKSAEEFYSFDAKYNIPNSQTIIPAKIEKKLIEEIQKNAIKAFKSIDGRGLARVDFFIEEGTNNIYINEINTMPGFTKISMYPKLFESDKISYSELLDILINYAISKFDFT